MRDDPMREGPVAVDQEDTDDGRPSVARVHDFLVGGRHHRRVDREFAAELVAAFPGIDEVIRELLTFRPRVVAHLAAQGVDQYVDLGAGLPTVRPTHEVAAAAGVAPRVVYVDNDPDVVRAARDVLAGVGGATVVEGDAGRSEPWWPRVAEHLDLGRPVAVVASAVLHYVDDDAALATLRAVRAATVPGSLLAVATLARTGRPEPLAWARHRHGGLSYAPRLREPHEMAGWLEGWAPAPPGWVAATHWEPGVTTGPHPADVGSAYWAVLAQRC